MGAIEGETTNRWFASPSPGGKIRKKSDLLAFHRLKRFFPECEEGAKGITTSSETMPKTKKIDPSLRKMVEFSSKLDGLQKKCPNPETRLKFLRGKINRKKTAEEILKVDVDVRRLSQKTFRDKSKQFRNDCKNVIERYVIVKILDISLVKLIVRIVALIRKFFRNLFFRGVYDSEKQRVKELNRLHIVDDVFRLEFLTTYKNRVVKKKLMKEFLDHMKSDGIITEQENIHLSKKDVSYVFSYFSVKKLHELDQTDGAEKAFLDLINFSVRKLEQKKRELATKIGKREIGKLLGEVEKSSSREMGSLAHLMEPFNQTEKLSNDEQEKVIGRIIGELKNIDLDQISDPSLRFQLKALTGESTKNRANIASFLYSIWSAEVLSEQWNDLQDIQNEMEFLTDSVSANASSDLEEKLYTLHQSYGLIMRASKFDFPEGYSRIVGDFRQEWDKINGLYEKMRSGEEHSYRLHALDNCAFNGIEENNWPAYTSVLDVLDGEKIEDLVVEGEPILLKAAGRENSPKPRITVFTCRSGSGHIMVTKSIAQSLSDCSVQVADIYEDLLRPLDIVSKFFPENTLEDGHNFLMKHEAYKLVGFMQKLVPLFVRLNMEDYEELISEYVDRERPDILISSIPILNAAFVNVAKKFNIPLLIVTTDMETFGFTNLMTREHCDVDYSRYKMIYSYDKSILNGDIASRLPEHLTDKLLDNFGPPLRYRFHKSFTEEQLDEVRKEFGIQPEEKVILTMVGGNAAISIKGYAEDFSQMSDEEISEILADDSETPVRMICICGDSSIEKNTKLRDRINALNGKSKSSRVRFTAVDKTPKIAELVSLPEMQTVITKPGGSTVSEMLWMDMPMVLHTVGKVPEWEKTNLIYCQQKDAGTIYNSKASIFKRKRREGLKRALQTSFAKKKEIERNNPDRASKASVFTKKLRKTVAQMLNPKAAAASSTKRSYESLVAVAVNSDPLQRAD